MIVRRNFALLVLVVSSAVLVMSCGPSASCAVRQGDRGNPINWIVGRRC